MKNMDYTDDKLKRIIQQSGIEQPSADFTERLMQRIQLTPLTEDVKEIKTKYWFIIIPAILLFLVGSVIAAFMIFDINLKAVFSFDSVGINNGISATTSLFKQLADLLSSYRYFIYIGILGLLLLTSDLLIRRHIFSKHPMQS